MKINGLLRNLNSNNVSKNCRNHPFLNAVYNVVSIHYISCRYTNEVGENYLIIDYLNIYKGKIFVDILIISPSIENSLEKIND